MGQHRTNRHGDHQRNTISNFNRGQHLHSDLDNVSEVDISGLVSQGPHGVWWTADDLTFTVAAVPEPSTWAMLILGFLGVGLMAYRRKAAARNAA
jgi:hypothetical protein